MTWQFDTPAERAAAIARRKAIYEELHPETKHGTPGVSCQVGDTRERVDVNRFTKATAEAIGESERKMQREAHRGEAIGEAALAKIARTALDKGARAGRARRCRRPARRAPRP